MPTACSLALRLFQRSFHRGSCHETILMPMESGDIGGNPSF
jgi:hypothetical protein